MTMGGEPRQYRPGVLTAPAFGPPEFCRTDIVKARKDHTCVRCKGVIPKGQEYIAETTPPWYGEWDGDQSDSGRVYGYAVNTHKWSVKRYHLLVNCNLSQEAKQAVEDDAWARMP